MIKMIELATEECIHMENAKNENEYEYDDNLIELSLHELHVLYATQQGIIFCPIFLSYL